MSFFLSSFFVCTEGKEKEKSKEKEQSDPIESNPSKETIEENQLTSDADKAKDGTQQLNTSKQNPIKQSYLSVLGSKPVGNKPSKIIIQAILLLSFSSVKLIFFLVYI